MPCVQSDMVPGLSVGSLICGKGNQALIVEEALNWTTLVGEDIWQLQGGRTCFTFNICGGDFDCGINFRFCSDWKKWCWNLSIFLASFLLIKITVYIFEVPNGSSWISSYLSPLQMGILQMGTLKSTILVLVEYAWYVVSVFSYRFVYVRYPC